MRVKPLRTVLLFNSGISKEMRLFAMLVVLYISVAHLWKTVGLKALLFSSSSLMQFCDVILSVFTLCIVTQS